jgi:hypothetical protein
VGAGRENMLRHCLHNMCSLPAAPPTTPFRGAQAILRAKLFHVVKAIPLPATTPTTPFRGAQAIFRTKPFHVQYPTFSTAVTLHTYSPMKMEQTEWSETLAFKLQTPLNHPEESTQYSEHGES